MNSQFKAVDPQGTVYFCEVMPDNGIMVDIGTEYKIVCRHWLSPAELDGRLKSSLPADALTAINAGLRAYNHRKAFAKAA